MVFVLSIFRYVCASEKFSNSMLFDIESYYAKGLLLSPVPGTQVMCPITDLRMCRSISSKGPAWPEGGGDGDNAWHPSERTLLAAFVVG